jgi:hypothetical protein
VCRAPAIFWQLVTIIASIVLPFARTAWTQCRETRLHASWLSSVPLTSIRRGTCVASDEESPNCFKLQCFVMLRHGVFSEFDRRTVPRRCELGVFVVLQHYTKPKHFVNKAHSLNADSYFVYADSTVTSFNHFYFVLYVTRVVSVVFSCYIIIQ